MLLQRPSTHVASCPPNQCSSTRALYQHNQHRARTAVVARAVGLSSISSSSSSAASAAVCSSNTASASQLPVTTATTGSQKQLTKRILSCSNLAAVSAVCLQYQQQLTPIHISAVLTVCAKRFAPARPGQHDSQQQQQLLHSLVADALQLLAAQQHLCSAREVSTVLWCLARLQFRLPHTTVQRLLSHYVDVGAASTSQSTAMVMYAIAKLGLEPGAAHLDCLLHGLVKAVRRTEALPGLHSLGAMQQGLMLAGEESWHTHRSGHLPQQQTSELPCPQHQQTPALTAWPTLSQPQHMWALSTTIWAIARLQQQEAAQAWLLPLLHLLHSSSGGGGSSSSSDGNGGSQIVGGVDLQQPAAACTGTHQMPPPGAAVEGCRACAVALWACATILGARPAASGELQPVQSVPVLLHGHHLQQRHYQRFSAAVVCQAGQLLHTYEKWLDGLQPQSACMLLWAVNRLGITPSHTWCQHYYTAAQRIAGQLSPSQCAALLCGAAYLPVRPPAVLCARCLSVLQPHLHVLPAAQLSQLLRACGRLRVRPPAHWVNTLLEAFLARSQEHSPAAISTLMHAASRVGFKPAAAALAMLLSSVDRQLQSFRPHDLAKLLSGCAALLLQLPDSLHQALLQSFVAQLQHASPSDVTLVLRALARRCSHQQQLQHQHRQQHQNSAFATGLPGGGCQAPGWQSAARPVAVPAGQSGVSHDLGETAAGQMVGSTMQPRGCPWPPAVVWQASPQQPQQPQQHACCTPGSLRAPACDIRTVFSRAYALIHSMKPAELCQCVWAAAWLQPASGMLWSQAINSALPGRVQSLAPGDICLLFWALSRLKHSLHIEQHLLQQLLRRSQALMLQGCCSPRDLTAVVWGVVHTSARATGLPAAWTKAFSTAVLQQMPRFSGRQLGVTLRACVLLHLPLDQQLLNAFVLQVEVRSALLNKAQLATLMSSLAALQQEHYATCTAPAWTSCGMLGSSRLNTSHMNDHATMPLQAQTRQDALLPMPTVV